MLYYVYFSNAGVPQPGLNPEWISLQDANAEGENRLASAPSVLEVGGTENGHGWYYFDIIFGTAPWANTAADLVGIIDGGINPSAEFLSDDDRYKPITISLRGLALARIAHTGIQNKTTGDVDIYATDGTTKELKLDFTSSATEITRTPSAP